MISQNKIDAIKEAVSLLDLASEHVRLKRRGTSHVGLCPFHAERTPSFNVGKKDEREFFHCFGCGVGGDVIAFVQKIENVGFEFAVRTLAKSAGIEIEDAPSGNTEAESIYSANEFAAKFFQRNLTEAAKTYLLGRLEAETIARFGLGCAGEGWHNLRDALQEKGFSEDAAVKSGLVRRGERGAYDVFRCGRIMIPIRNEMGNIVGFGGRAMRKEDEPLYVNTGESAVYRKGNFLFGAFESRAKIKEARRVILVEGYFDAMKLIERDYPAVAVCGTSLTQAQVAKIYCVADKVTIMFDGDKAGRAAAEKAGKMLVHKLSDVLVATTPDGKDPDELSGDDLCESVVWAKSFFKHCCSIGWEFGELVKLTTMIESALARRDAIDIIASNFRLSQEAVESEVDKIKNKKRTPTVAQTQVTVARHGAPQDETDRLYFDRVGARAERVREILSHKETL